MPLPPSAESAAVLADFARRGLLGEISGQERIARVKLLARLASEGVTLDELAEAVAEDRLGTLLIERALAGPDAYTEAQVAEMAGVDPGLLNRWHRAIGLPSPGAEVPAYDDEDVALARRLQEYLESGIPPESLLTVGRTLGLGLGRVAEAIGGMIGEALLEIVELDAQLALRYASEARALSELDAPLVLARVLSRHLASTIRSQTVAIAQQGGELTAGQEVAVCFADLVGFTRLGEEISAEELGRVAELLASVTTDAIAPPVQLVKTIGDEVMLVSPDADALIEVALSLVERVGERAGEMPPLRVGIAAGTAISRGGDWYGAPVNLASRLTGAARPGTVLVSEAARRASTRAAWRWEQGEGKRFKGVRGEQVTFSVQRRAVDRARAGGPTERQ